MTQDETATPEAPFGAAPPALRPLLLEMNDLKRIRSAGRNGSIATRLFREAWGRLVAGEAVGVVLLRITAASVAAARLGDLDASRLRALGLPGDAADETLARAFDALAGDVAEPLRGRLRAALGGLERDVEGAVPAFVAALEAQPRAGITCPGRPRIMLEPPESHAEHCLMVAVYGVLLIPAYGAGAGPVFRTHLQHH